MGYKVGLGLGRVEQGPASFQAPVAVPPNARKIGLGHSVPSTNLTNETWDFSQEQIIVEEKVDWLNNTNSTDITPSDLENWLKEGPSSTEVIKNSPFCDKTVIENVFNAKNIFDELDAEDLNKARTRANPFETIRAMFFMNRAALKMVNIDAACDFMFTTMEENENFSNKEGPIYFADICAGPGGFTEYILWRKKWWYKGFGMTLKDEHDFKVADSCCASIAMFQPLYGADERGDICNPDNLTDFADRVANESKGGLHFMMSDGGFSVKGQESLQEVISKTIYVCQCILALKTLRPHGHFVTKTFDIFTPFSVGLLYLMYLCFESVGIIKPNSSRPANSERYFVCRNFKADVRTTVIKEYMWKIVFRLWELKTLDKDILEIVDAEVLKQDAAFFQYIFDSNTRIGNQQIVALKKLAAFCRNPNLIEARQDDLRSQSLEYWKLPNQNRKRIFYRVQDLLTDLGLKISQVVFQLRYVHSWEAARAKLGNINNWLCAYIYSSDRSQTVNFVAGVGYSNTFHLQNNQNWVKIQSLHLVKGTLLLADFVKEKIFVNNQQVTRHSLHVIDAVSLGSMNLLGHSFEERSKLIRIFCKAVNKESQSIYSVRVRPKPMQKLSNFLSDDSLIRNPSTGASDHWVRSGMNEFHKVNMFMPCQYLDQFKKHIAQEWSMI
ncbi:hypothetical protein YQE_01847, partial [Dendroctonus ponderosae]